MKDLIRSFTSFTRPERLGIIVLSAILLMLLIFRAAMPYFVHPNVDPEQERKLQAQWTTFKKEHPSSTTTDTAAAKIKEHQDEFDNSPTPLPDSIDLNTADSALLVRLRGVGPVTAGKMVAWRKKHGDFTNVEQIKETGGFSPDAFELLKKHLIIRPSKHN